LLNYAAESGVEVDANIRDQVLSAEAAGQASDKQTRANLLSALTHLSAKLKPVTADSLKACAREQKSHRTLKIYRRTVIGLAIIIVPFSVITFVTTALSDAIRKDIATANALAVKLGAELGPPNPKLPEINGRKIPPGVPVTEAIADLQLFAATTRAIYSTARQLEDFGLTSSDPFARLKNSDKKPAELSTLSGSETTEELVKKFRNDRSAVRKILELPQGLPDLPLAADDMIAVYQSVRHFSLTIVDRVSVWYGAMGACVLPVLYALWGACAYMLRLFEAQIRNRTFTATEATTARFVIAAIGGAVIGLFNNFNVAQAPTLPPLAVAFLVGYAVDVFFAFLEALIQTFGRARSDGPANPRQRTPSRGSQE
jgi:hypothetical protein